MLAVTGAWVIGPAMSNLSKLEASGVIIGAVGGLIGAISALLTIPTAGREVWETYFGQPEVELIKSSPLEITYNSANRLLIFSCGLTFNNNGYTSERAAISNIIFGVPNDEQRQVHLDVDLASCSKGNNKQPKLMAINKGESESINCEARAFLWEVDALLDQHETRKVFVIEFRGKKEKDYSSIFYFDTSKELVALLRRDSDQISGFRFVGSDVQ